MNEQDKKQGKQLTEVEVDNLSGKKKKNQNNDSEDLRKKKKKEAGIEKRQGMFNKDLEELKNKQR